MQTNPFPRSMPFYDRQWAARLVERCDDLIQFLRGDFQPIGRLEDVLGRRKGVVYVTDSTYTLQQSDHIVVVNYAGAATMTLLETPDQGTYHEIIDGSGAAGTNNITIQRSGSGLINGTATSLTINANYGGYRMFFEGNVGSWLAHAL